MNRFIEYGHFTSVPTSLKRPSKLKLFFFNLRKKKDPKATALIRSTFKRHKALAFGTHGTLSKNLPSIKEIGLHSHEKWSYNHISRFKLLRILRAHGKTGAYREIKRMISNNVSYGITRYEEQHYDQKARIFPSIPFDKIGVVVGRVPWYREAFETDSKAVGRSSWEHISRNNVIATLTLSPVDIETLNAKFPTVGGAIPEWNVNHSNGNALRDKVIAEVCRLMTKRVIREMVQSKPVKS